MDKALKKRVFRELLPFVEKPSRYIGNEINLAVKDPECITVSWCMAFPDAYEIGMSHTGSQILYHILNKLSFVAAERTYTPWGDMATLMQEKDIPLYTLEQFKPVKSYDIVGFSLQSELNYTNIFTMLQLAGIPVRAKERTADDPLIIAGGPNAYNPAPLAAFIDAFVVGDGEESAPLVAEAIQRMKEQGASRSEMLKELANLPGLYVPNISKIPVKAALVPVLKAEYMPDRSLIPISRITHDRLAVEIMRGCLHGCRFCSAGMLYRPVRERSADDILAVVDRELKVNGWEEVSLLSLSSADHSQFEPLLGELACRDAKISVPSQRLDTFLEKGDSIQGIKRGGLTFAPEAGTDRLRQVINKSITSKQLIDAAEIAFTNGWRLIKLYFMIGLPTETDEDLQGIVALVKTMRTFTRGRRDLVKVTISPFIPKPFTPFQWEEQVDDVELHRRSVFIKNQLRGIKNVECSYRDTKLSLIEGIISRGSALEGETLYTAWKNGARFDGWTDCFSLQAWEHAITTTGLDTRVSLGARSIDEPLPWEIIDAGIDRAYLVKEKERAYTASMTADCVGGSCRACGRCDDEMQVQISDKVTVPKVSSTPPAEEKAYGTDENQPAFGRKRQKVVTAAATAEIRKRVRFSRGEEVMYVSHLDIIQIFQRCLKRTGIPVALTQGMRPHQKLAFGLPLMVGATSNAEYIDISLEPGFTDNLGAQLNEVLPTGIRIIDEKMVFSKPKSLNAVANLAIYEVDISMFADRAEVVKKLAAWQDEETMITAISKKGILKQVDLKPFLDELEIIENEKDGTVVRFRIHVDQAKGTVKPITFIKWCCPDAELRDLPITRMELLVRNSTGQIRTPMEVV